MRVVHNAGVVTVEHLTGKSLCLSLHVLTVLLGSEHAHTLDDSDRFKRPSVFRGLAAREVANGYTVAEVSRNIRAMHRPEDRKALFAAGGRWLTSKDVANACAAWKKQHPSSQQRGSFESWQEQALAVRESLEKEGWHVEPIQVSSYPLYTTLLTLL